MFNVKLGFVEIEKNENSFRVIYEKVNLFNVVFMCIMVFYKDKLELNFVNNF